VAHRTHLGEGESVAGEGQLLDQLFDCFAARNVLLGTLKPVIGDRELGGLQQKTSNVNNTNKIGRCPEASF
jgi:hypothetical protein